MLKRIWNRGLNSSVAKLRFRPRCDVLEDRTVPTVLEPGFTEATYLTATGLFGATGLAWAPDGSNRFYVSRQGGEVRVIQNGLLLTLPFSTDSVYSGNLTVDVAPGAFLLSGVSPQNNSVSVPPGAIVVAGSGTNTVRLTFFGASGVEFGSLIDGLWQLTIVNTLITVSGGGPAMLASYTSTVIKRLYGDADGNGSVSSQDFNNFAFAFGKSSFAFDFDNNGTVDAIDFGEFGNRFGATL